jgi:hypothetical protein
MAIWRVDRDIELRITHHTCRCEISTSVIIDNPNTDFRALCCTFATKPISVRIVFEQSKFLRAMFSLEFARRWKFMKSHRHSST